MTDEERINRLKAEIESWKTSAGNAKANELTAEKEIARITKAIRSIPVHNFYKGDVLFRDDVIEALEGKR